MGVTKPAADRHYDSVQAAAYMRAKYGLTEYEIHDFHDFFILNGGGNGYLAHLSRDEYEDGFNGAMGDRDPNRADAYSVYGLYLDEFADENGEFYLHIWW